MIKYLVIILAILSLCSCESDTKIQTQTPENGVVIEERKDSIAIVNQEIKEDPSNPELYYKKAMIYVRQIQTDEALQELDRAIAADSTNPKYYLMKSDLYFNTKNMAGAKLEAENALKVDNKNTEAYLRLGWIAYIIQSYERAFQFVNEALQIDRYLAEAYYLKGVIYKETEDYTAAISSFSTATEQDNNYYDAWIELGLLGAMADHELTTYYYDNAIRIDSTRYDALYNKGYYVQEKGEYRVAINLYKQLIRHTPSFYNAYYNKGYIYLEYLQQYDSAIYEFNNVLSINQLNHKAFYNRGLAYERMGDMRKAMADYEQSLELNPKFDLAAEGKSRILEQSK